MPVILPNQSDFNQILANIKSEWYEKLHVLADFDCTITKLTSNSWKKIPSLMTLLEFVKYWLNPECIEELRDYFNIYHPIETDPHYPIEEKKRKMQKWWEYVLNSLIKHWLSQDILIEVAKNKEVKIRNWIINLLKFLYENNIPLVIISASGIWIKSIEYFLKERQLFFPNISIVSNDFEWNEKWIAIWYKTPIIHSFNKWESILKRQFPWIYSKIENKKNVIVLWDSLWDHHMIDWFRYDNLILIWFLNQKIEENLEAYTKRYNMVLTWDSEAEELAWLFI